MKEQSDILVIISDSQIEYESSIVLSQYMVVVRRKIQLRKMVKIVKIINSENRVVSWKIYLSNIKLSFPNQQAILYSWTDMIITVNWEVRVYANLEFSQIELSLDG